MEIKNTQIALTREQIESVISLYSSGNFNQAINRIKELNNDYPNVPILFNILGACYKAIGDMEGAIQMFDTATKIKPNYAEAFFNLAVIHQEQKGYEDAISSYKKAIEANPKYPDAHNNLGIIYLNLNELDFAIEYFELAIKHKSDFAEAHNNLGSAYQEKGNLKSSINSYKKAIKLKPNYTQAFNNLGILNQKKGNLIDSKLNYENAIVIDPSYVSAHFNLTALKNYTDDMDPQVIQMKTLLSSSEVSQSDRIKLNFALSKVNEDIDDKEKMFQFLDEGNRLRKLELNFAFDDSDKYNSLVKDLFPLPIENKISSKICPIFIVGMPRSGTSLVEQIISSHPNVFGGGELKYLTEILIPLFQNGSATKDNLTEEILFSIRENYEKKLDSLNFSQNNITDKWPLNFRNIGFILSAFPDAKIIHINRDPVATCWSIYKHYFSGDGNGWAYNLNDISKFYLMYKDLMDFWNHSFPDKIFNLSYEDLTKNQKKQTESLLEYCNLEWNEDCLNFQNNARSVDTASSVQVRQKMYQGSSETWKKYEDYLEPLINNFIKI
jgi:tetratricopeptide (TPR) repeat protein